MILDHCRLLNRIDLTSCRGVGVRLRRGIFEAWEEDRSRGKGDADKEETDPEAGRRGRRTRRRMD